MTVSTRGSLGLSLATLLLASTARTDEPALVELAAPASPAPAAPSAPEPVAAAAALAVPLAPAPSRDDHDLRSKRVSLAYLGLRVVPGLTLDGNTLTIDPKGSATLAVTPDDSAVPLFGVRYWFGTTLGLDIGAGFGTERGSFTRLVPNPDPTLDRTEEGASARRTTFAARVSVPISFHSGRHHNLLVIPELDLGYSTATLPGFRQSTTGEPLDLSLTGFGFGAGARLAGELHFGFWGVPELSLQASWGLRLDADRRRGAIGVAETTLSDLAVGTTASSDPWRLVAGGLALLYGL
jgi:hypothetical protein